MWLLRRDKIELFISTFLYVWTINGAEAHVGTVIMLRNPKQAFFFSFFFLSRPETTKHRFLTLQVKTSESVQAVKDTVLFYPLVSASCIRWYVLWWTSISVLAGASATVFYPQHEGDPTQFDRLKVWCCGRRLAALLVLSEPIRESERVAAQKHNLHILTGLLVTKGIFYFILPFFLKQTSHDIFCIWGIRKNKNPKGLALTVVTTDFEHNTIWTITIK